jgi:hypothetical protein
MMLFELGVLLGGEAEPHRPSTHLNGVVKGLSVFQPFAFREAVEHLSNFGSVGEVELSSEGSLQIRLEELAVPVPRQLHKVHVNAVHEESLSGGGL